MNNTLFVKLVDHLMGFKLVVVEPGTIITVTDVLTEESVDVPPDGAVTVGNTMYCQKGVYDKLVKEFGSAIKK